MGLHDTIMAKSPAVVSVTARAVASPRHLTWVRCHRVKVWVAVTARVMSAITHGTGVPMAVPQDLLLGRPFR